MKNLLKILLLLFPCVIFGQSKSWQYDPITGRTNLFGNTKPTTWQVFVSDSISTSNRGAIKFYQSSVIFNAFKGTGIRSLVTDANGNISTIATTSGDTNFVRSVSSSNSDISIANGSKRPNFTLNSGTGANQISKRDANGGIVFKNSTVNVGDNGQNIVGIGSNYLYLYSGTNGINFTNQANTATTATLSNTGAFIAASIAKTGGLSTQELLADGSVRTIITNNNQLTNGANYITQAIGDARYIPLTGSSSITGNLIGNVTDFKVGKNASNSFIRFNDTELITILINGSNNCGFQSSSGGTSATTYSRLFVGSGKQFTLTDNGSASMSGAIIEYNVSRATELNASTYGLIDKNYADARYLSLAGNEQITRSHIYKASGTFDIGVTNGTNFSTVTYSANSIQQQVNIGGHGASITLNSDGTSANTSAGISAGSKSIYFTESTNAVLSGTVIENATDQTTQVNATGDRAIADRGYNDARYITKISTITGIDAKTTGVTPLYTVPSGKKLTIKGMVVRCSAATAITNGPTLGVGVASGEDDMFASTAINALTTTSKNYQMPTIGMSVNANAGDVIKVGVDAGSTGTSQTIEIDLFGIIQ